MLPWAYSDLIRLDIPGTLGVSPSGSPYLRSPPPSTMETSPWGPLAMRPTREELRACVELPRKKKRSVKRKAQDSLESSLTARVRPRSWEYLLRHRLSRSGDQNPKFG